MIPRRKFLRLLLAPVAALGVRLLPGSVPGAVSYRGWILSARDVTRLRGLKGMRRP